MKDRIKRVFAPIDRMDYILISILGGANLLILLGFGVFFTIAFFAVLLILPELNIKIIDDFADLYILQFLLLALLETVIAGAMIRKFRLWLLSLPLQFVLYSGILCIQNLSSGNEVSIAFNALVAAIIILVQLPGITVGLLIRWSVRKIRTYISTHFAKTVEPITPTDSVDLSMQADHVEKKKTKVGKLIGQLFGGSSIKELLILLIYIIFNCLYLFYLSLIEFYVQNFMLMASIEASNTGFPSREQIDFIYLLAKCVVIGLSAIPTAFIISKLRTWLISLPIQAALYLAILWYTIRYRFDGEWLSSVYLLAAQAICVTVGLLIRRLVRKIRTRKAPVPAV